ncbi:MAG: adenylyl-sulfate kinase [Thermoplasmata archaeon]
MPGNAAEDSQGFVLWIEGLPGSGKSTVSLETKVRLKALGWNTEILDGARILRAILRPFRPSLRARGRQRILLLAWSAYALVWNEVRHTLSPESGFARGDREFQTRRVSYVARMLARDGVAVIVPMITPHETSRRAARSDVSVRFAEVWLRCPLEVRRRRDPKGFYNQTQGRGLKTLSEIVEAFEEPRNPDLVVDTSAATPGDCACRILEYLATEGYVRPLAGVVDNPGVPSGATSSGNV